MPKELEPSNNEKSFILEALSEGIRLDEREFDAFRDLELEFGKDYGLADVRLGKTRFAFTPCLHYCALWISYGVEADYV